MKLILEALTLAVVIVLTSARAIDFYQQQLDDLLEVGVHDGHIDTRVLDENTDDADVDNTDKYIDERAWDELFAGYRATVDWPGAAYWRELAEHYPNAKVI